MIGYAEWRSQFFIDIYQFQLQEGKTILVTPLIIHAFFVPLHK